MGKENNTQKSSVISWKLPNQSDLGPELSIPGRGLESHQASGKGGQPEREKPPLLAIPLRWAAERAAPGASAGPELRPACAPSVLC